MNRKAIQQNPYLVTIIKTVQLHSNVVWPTNVMMPSIAYLAKRSQVINVILNMNVYLVVVIMANVTFLVIAQLDVKRIKIAIIHNVAQIRYVPIA